MRIPIVTSGTSGMIADIPASMLPVDAFTLVENMIFLNRRGKRWGSPTAIGIALAGTVQNLYSFRAFGTRPGLFATLNTKIMYTVGAAVADYTGASGPYASVKGWTYTNFNGIPIFTAEEHKPQAVLDPDVGPAQDLPNWPATWKARFVKQFKNILVAGNLTVGGVSSPYLMATSSVTDPGAVPASWDFTNPATLATENVLAEEGEIIAGDTLGDDFIIYKDVRTIQMQIGGPNLYSYRVLFTQGIIGKFAMCTFTHKVKGQEKHFVVGQEDIYIHNGSMIEPVFADWIKDYFYSVLNPQAFDQVYCIDFKAINCIFVCFPRGNATLPSHALVWNYQNGAVSIIDLQSTWPVTVGNLIAYVAADQTWDADAQVWDLDTTVWNDFEDTQVLSYMVGVQAGQIVKLNNGAPTAVVLLERDGLNVLGKDEKGNPVFDTDRRKLFEGVYPRISGVGTVNITMGSHEIESEAIDWGTPEPFILGTDIKADAYSIGRIGAIRIQSTDSSVWTFIGYDLEVRDAGGGRV